MLFGATTWPRLFVNDQGWTFFVYLQYSLQTSVAGHLHCEQYQPFRGMESARRHFEATNEWSTDGPSRWSLVFRSRFKITGKLF
jgi:hypothetical protein